MSAININPLNSNNFAALTGPMGVNIDSDSDDRNSSADNITQQPAPTTAFSNFVKSPIAIPVAAGVAMIPVWLRDVYLNTIKAAAPSDELKKLVSYLTDINPNSIGKTLSLRKAAQARLATDGYLKDDNELLKLFLDRYPEAEQKAAARDSIFRLVTMFDQAQAAGYGIRNKSDVDGTLFGVKTLIDVSGDKAPDFRRVLINTVVPLINKLRGTYSAAQKYGEEWWHQMPMTEAAEAMFRRGIIKGQAVDLHRNWVRSFQNQAESMDYYDLEHRKLQAAIAALTARVGSESTMSTIRIPQDLIFQGEHEHTTILDNFGGLAHELGLHMHPDSPTRRLFGVNGVCNIGIRDFERYVPKVTREGVKAFEAMRQMKSPGADAMLAELKKIPPGTERDKIYLTKYSNVCFGLAEEFRNFLLTRVTEFKGPSRYSFELLEEVNKLYEGRRKEDIDRHPALWQDRLAVTLQEGYEAHLAGASKQAVLGKLLKKLKPISEATEYHPHLLSGSKTAKERSERIRRINSMYDERNGSIPIPTKRWLELVSCLEDPKVTTEQAYKKISEMLYVAPVVITRHSLGPDLDGIYTPTEDVQVDRMKLLQAQQFAKYADHPAGKALLAQISKERGLAEGKELVGIIYSERPPVHVIGKDGKPIKDASRYLINVLNNATEDKKSVFVIGEDGNKRGIDEPIAAYTEAIYGGIKKESAIPSKRKLGQVFMVGGDSPGSDAKMIAKNVVVDPLSWSVITRNLTRQEKMNEVFIWALNQKSHKDDIKADPTLEAQLKLCPLLYKEIDKDKYQVIGEGPFKGQVFTDPEKFLVESKLIEQLLMPRVIRFADVEPHNLGLLVALCQANGLKPNSIKQLIDNPKLLLDVVAPNRKKYRFGACFETLQNPPEWQPEISKHRRNPYEFGNLAIRNAPFFAHRARMAGMLALLGGGTSLLGQHIWRDLHKNDPTSSNGTGDESADMQNLLTKFMRAGFLLLNGGIFANNLIPLPVRQPLSLLGSSLGIASAFMTGPAQIFSGLGSIAMNLFGWANEENRLRQADANLPEDPKQLLDSLKHVNRNWNTKDPIYKGKTYWIGAKSVELESKFRNRAKAMKRNGIPGALAVTAARFAQIGDMAGEMISSPQFAKEMLRPVPKKEFVRGVTINLPHGPQYLLAAGGLLSASLLLGAVGWNAYKHSALGGHQSNSSNNDDDGGIDPPTLTMVGGATVSSMIPYLWWGRAISKNSFGEPVCAEYLGTKHRDIISQPGTNGRMMIGGAALATIGASMSWLPGDAGTIFNDLNSIGLGPLGLSWANYDCINRYDMPKQAAEQLGYLWTPAMEHLKYVQKAKARGWATPFSK